MLLFIAPTFSTILCKALTSSSCTTHTISMVYKVWQANIEIAPNKMLNVRLFNFSSLGQQLLTKTFEVICSNLFSKYYSETKEP